MIGINTGKIIIGSAYLGQKREIDCDQAKMQSLLLAQMPSGRVKTSQESIYLKKQYLGIGSTKKTQQKAFYAFSEFLRKLRNWLA